MSFWNEYKADDLSVYDYELQLLMAAQDKIPSLHLFEYLWSDWLSDNLKFENNTYKITTRIMGASDILVGTVGTFYSIRKPTLLSTLGDLYFADLATTGSNIMWSGEYEKTYFDKILDNAEANDLITFGSNILASGSLTGLKTLQLSKYKNEVINIEAGFNPIPYARNIDSSFIHSAPSVIFGKADNLINITTASQKLIIFENPYLYTPINSEVLRVLKPGGTIEIIGGASNGYVNKAVSVTNLDKFGLKLIDKVPVNNIDKYMRTDKINLNQKCTVYKYTIKQK